MTDIRLDLHCHTTASDGVYSPLEVVEKAVQAGVTHLAITDHDSFAGSDSLRGIPLPLTLLPGVELSLRDMHGLHLLGYGYTADTPLHRTVAELADKRRDRAKAMVDKLCALGMPLDYEEIAAQAQGSVGRPHIARAMVQRGYVPSVEKAFKKWIGNGRPAYCAGYQLSMAQALPLMRESGFVPVLAHPAELGVSDQALRALLEVWRERGLMGVEVYHPSQLRHGFARLDALARSMGFLVTGGSDFHVEGDNHGALGAMVWRSAAEDWEALARSSPLSFDYPTRAHSR